MSDLESIVDRNSRRPGYTLATYREVALPYWKYSLNCRVLKRKRIPVTEEFVLRSIEAGLQTDEQVTRFLGIPARVVETTMGSLVSAGHLTPVPHADKTQRLGFALTQRGHLAVSELVEEVPSEQTLELAYDGLRRVFTLVDEPMRWRPRDIAGVGLLEIPSFPPDPPTAGPKDTAEVAAVLSEVLTRADSELLSVLGLNGRREKFFVRAVALIFQPNDRRGEPAVNFLVDGRPSPGHDDAFAAAEGRRKLGLLDQLEVDGLASTQKAVSQEVLARMPDSGEVADLRRITSVLRERHARLSGERTSSSLPQATRDEIADSAAQLEDAEAVLDLLPVRVLEVHEHPGFLRDALDNARDRLLIVSPWIRAGVVDDAFREKVNKLLEAGVEVCIAYGIDDGTNTPERDRQAEEKLRVIASRYSNFKLARLGDTHAKVLVVDDRYVIATSFNWLSFRGDPNLPFRDERGTLVTVQSEIGRIYDDYLSRVESTEKRL